MEQEQDRLAQRQASSSKSVDIALKQFLRLLVWLRRVLLQDCAILFAKYPSCAMFRYPPFDSPTFRKFAASALSVVDQAEEDVRHALKNLPEHVAATFRGLATDIKMDQHSQRINTEARWDAVDSRLDQVTGLLQLLIGAKSLKGGRKANKGFSFPSQFMFVCGILIQTWQSRVPFPKYTPRLTLTTLSKPFLMSDHSSLLRHPLQPPFLTSQSTSPTPPLAHLSQA